MNRLCAAIHMYSLYDRLTLFFALDDEINFFVVVTNNIIWAKMSFVLSACNTFSIWLLFIRFVMVAHYDGPRLLHM